MHRNAWERYFDISVIFNLLQLFLLYFYNLYTYSEYQDYLDILESEEQRILEDHLRDLEHL